MNNTLKDGWWISSYFPAQPRRAARRPSLEDKQNETNDLDIIPIANALHSLPINWHLIMCYYISGNVKNKKRSNQAVQVDMRQVMRARRLFAECQSVVSRAALYIGRAVPQRKPAPRASRGASAALHWVVAGFFLISSVRPISLSTYLY